MTKILCATQTSSFQTFRCPSGNTYTSFRGVPFEVNNKEDVDYFLKKPQFEKASVLKKPKMKSKPSLDRTQAFKEWLESVKLTPSQVEKVISVCGSKTILERTLFQKGTVEGLTEKAVNKLKKALEKKE